MKKAYTNNTKRVQHIGNITVQPGQTRECEEIHIQAHTGVVSNIEEETVATETPMLLLSKKSIKKIKLEMPNLEGEDLDALEKIELEQDQPRSGLLEAITEERLNRAAGSEEAGLNEFITSLDGMSDAELLEQRELYTDEGDSVAYLDAVNTEIEQRGIED